jgi:hypothetical protein
MLTCTPSSIAIAIILTAVASRTVAQALVDLVTDPTDPGDAIYADGRMLANPNVTLAGSAVRGVAQLRRRQRHDPRPYFVIPAL